MTKGTDTWTAVPEQVELALDEPAQHDGRHECAVHRVEPPQHDERPTARTERQQPEDSGSREHLELGVRRLEPGREPIGVPPAQSHAEDRVCSQMSMESWNQLIRWNTELNLLPELTWSRTSVATMARPPATSEDQQLGAAPGLSVRRTTSATETESATMAWRDWVKSIPSRAEHEGYKGQPARPPHPRRLT